MANRQGELTIITKAKDLVNHTLKLTNNANLFPKRCASRSASVCRTSPFKFSMTS